MFKGKKPHYTHNDFKVTEEKTLYSGYLDLKTVTFQFRQFAGNMSPTIKRELLVAHQQVVAVLLFDPHRDEVVLLEQFRIGATEDKNSPWLLEIVAGAIEENESAESMAHREAQEEAGLVLQRLEPIYHYWVSPGVSAEYLHLYCAQVDASQAECVHGVAEEHEDIRVIKVKSDDAIDAIKTGRINNSVSIIALQWLALNKTELIKRWTNE